MKRNTPTPKRLKCVVNMSHLRIEALDNSGNPVVTKEKDFQGASYTKVAEVTYHKGDEVFLPEEYVKRLGKSVSVVMKPVEPEPITSADTDNVPDDGPKVSDLIPKETE